MNDERLSRRQLLALGAAGLVAGCTPTPPAMPRPAISGPPPIRIRYGPGRDQFCHLYEPDRSDPRPVVVLIHGGFWGSQYGLDLMTPLAYAFLAQGVAVWNVEYSRLGSGGGWPSTFTDVGAAIDHLKVIARTYTLDLQHVLAIGHSAGGHLALWAAGRSQIDETSQLYVRWPRPLCGVIGLAPIPDLRRALAADVQLVNTLLGGAPKTVPERYAAASPAELLPLDVPQVLIHGRDDRTVPVRLTEEYATLARSKGDSVTLLTPAGVGHFEPIDPLSGVWRLLHQQAFALLA